MGAFLFMNIFEYVRTQRQTYENDTIPVVEGYDYSQYRKIRREELYWAGIHEQKIFDAVFNGPPPFDNSKIKKSVINEYLKTDFDTKDVEIRPKKPTLESRVGSMLVTKALQNWMVDHQFSLFLNDFCWTRAKHGGVLVKKTADGVVTVPWKNVITDQSDILGGIIIERHRYTPAELLAMKSRGWANLEDAIALADDSSYVSECSQDQENQGDFIEVYEVHGILPESLIKEDGEDEKYERMMFILAGVDDFEINEDSKEKTENGLVLFEQTEKECPYKLLNRNPIAGRGLGTSVIEDLFESTKWKNFTLAEEMRMMSVAGKVLYITDDPKIPKNLHDGTVDNGTVLKKQRDTNFQQVSQAPTSIAQYGNTRAEWTAAERDITGMYEANTGEAGKSNTPFRAQALQALEGNARFEQYREEIGIFLEEVITDWILPAALKELSKEDAIYTDFSQAELALIDRSILTAETNNFITENVLEGRPVRPADVQLFQQELTSSLSELGTKRYVTEIKEVIREADGQVKIALTNEGLNKQGFFDTRSNLIGFFPEGDPRREALLDRIVDESGITQDELRIKQDQTDVKAAAFDAAEEPQSNVEKVLA